MQRPENLNDLYQKYLNGTASQDEIKHLFEQFNTVDGKNKLSTLVDHSLIENLPNDGRYDERAAELTRRVGAKLQTAITEKPIRRLRNSFWLLGAAATLLTVMGVLIMLHKQHTAQVAHFDVMPGGSHAVLQVAGNAPIQLDSNRHSIIFQASRVAYTGGGQLKNLAGQGASIATVTTPVGGQYTVELADGTKVTLNASSSLKFPSSFAGLAYRKVELAGEGYFQVAKDKLHPFIVSSRGQQVRVLGTHFNINAYGDDAKTITTLEEGSVEVSASTAHLRIAPGEKAELSSKDELHSSTADLESALAWKNGQLIFKSMPLDLIMKQVERWYGVTVRIDPAESKRVFSGGVSRSSKLSVLLNILKESGVTYELIQEANQKVLWIKDK